jgi:hypothetical protein
MAHSASIMLRGRGARLPHLRLLIGASSAGIAAIAVILYLLWPTWQAGGLRGPQQLPITVGGMLLNVPSKAIRMRVQRHSGPQDRIDLAFAYPALTAPEPQPHVSADTVDATPVAIDRLLLSIALPGDDLSPDERVRTIYPRYIDRRTTTTQDGLSGQAFLDSSPYRGEDLFTANGPAFAARCTRDQMTPGICLSQRRIDGVDMTFRFPREWLSQWQDLAAAMDRLIVQLRRHG